MRRRIAPTIGSNQIGSNAALAAQSGFPAINVPAGVTAGGFPVGIELIGRAFSEPTLLGLAYAFEQAARHGKPPPLTAMVRASSTADEVASGALSLVGLSGTATASGRNARPAAAVPFEATVDWRFDEATRTLAYDIRLLEASSAEGIGGTYLHHRIAGFNGGIAHVLAKSGKAQVRGKVALTESQAKALLAGELYVSILSKDSPLLGARADLVP